LLLERAQGLPDDATPTTDRTTDHAAATPDASAAATPDASAAATHYASAATPYASANTAKNMLCLRRPARPYF